MKKKKKSNNSTFVISIFEVTNFRNIGRSTFRHSKFWPPSVQPDRRKFFLLVLSSKPYKTWTFINFLLSHHIHGKKFGAAAAPWGNAVELNRRPQRALCIGRQLPYFGNAAFPVWGDCGTKVLRQQLPVNVVREQTV